MTNQRKIEAILLYFANSTNPKYLGKVKLMKLFYFLDFTHAKRYGAPVTYDTYYNLEHGPIPSKIKNMVDGLAEEGNQAILGNILTCKLSKQTKMCRMIPKREFDYKKDKDLFTKTEYEVLEETAKRFADATTNEIEEASHNESPWKMTRRKELIPYYLAAFDSDAKVSKEEIALMTSIF